MKRYCCAFVLFLSFSAIYVNAVSAPIKQNLPKQTNANSSNVEIKIMQIILQDEAITNYEESLSNRDSFEVFYAIALGLVPNELQKNFDAPITRLQFCRMSVQFLAIVSGIPKNEIQSSASLVSTFPDTTDIDVRTCDALGIVNGFSDGTFRPNEAITREQVARMLAGIVSVLEVTPYNEGITFSDVTGLWSEHYINTITSFENRILPKDSSGHYSRVMTGVNDSEFDPLSFFSRQQACITMFRLTCALSAYLTHHGFETPPNAFPEKDLTGYISSYNWDITPNTVIDSYFTNGKWLRANGTGVLYIDHVSDRMSFTIHASKAGERTAYTLSSYALRVDNHIFQSYSGVVLQFQSDGVIAITTNSQWREANPGRSMPDGIYYLVRKITEP